MLLVQLVLVETLIVEFRSRRRSGDSDSSILSSDRLLWGMRERNWGEKLVVYSRLIAVIDAAPDRAFWSDGVLPCFERRFSISTAWASFGVEVCSLARLTRVWYARTPPKAPASALLPMRALWTARALPMMGQRRASTWRFDMLPAPGETSWPAAVVERARSVAGDVFERNGHMDLDWRSRASMMVGGEIASARAQRNTCTRDCNCGSKGEEDRGRLELERCETDRISFICGGH